MYVKHPKAGLRRALSLLLTTMLVCIFCCQAVSAQEETEYESNVTKAKDGLVAVLDVTENAEKAGMGNIHFSLTNESGGYVSDIAVSIVLPESLVLVKGETEYAPVIAEGETAEITAQIRHTDVAGISCGTWVLIGGIVFAVVILVIVIAVLSGKKKRTVACLLLCGVLLGTVALPVSAGTSVRSLDVTAYFPYNGEFYPVTVTVQYRYTFVETDVRETNGMKQFEITYFWGPHYETMSNEDIIGKIKDCGFTSIPLEYSSLEQNKAALEVLRKYGLTCSALWDSRIQEIMGADPLLSPDVSQEEVDSIIAAVVADYAEYDDIIEGWWIQVEPCETRFAILGKIVSAFRKHSPYKTTFINLFPTYASAEQLGTKTYKEYLDAFVEQVDPHYISYDHYHFMFGGRANEGYFTNMELIRDKALESGLDPMLIVLLSKHLKFDDLTYSQLMWEVNTSLTYGMKRVSYFTLMIHYYQTESMFNAIISDQGELYPHYYDVQKINGWLLPLGQELFEKNSTAVFHLQRSKSELEKNCRMYTGYGDLGAVNGDDFLIGFFDDCSFMITNTKYKEGPNGENILEFIDIKDGLEYFEPLSGEWKNAEADGIAARNENGNLCILYEAGEGFLLRTAAQEG